MTLGCRIILMVAATLLHAAGVPVANAQRITLGATRIDANHFLTGEPLVGGTARIAVRLGQLPVRVHVAAERATGDAWRTGSLCFGLVDPDDCPDEALHDRARLSSISGGLGILLVENERLSLAVFGSRHRARVSVETRGETTGGRVSPSDRHSGYDMGIDAAWSPWRSLPIALELGLTTGKLDGQGPMYIDGYSPFTEKFSLERVFVGATWRPRW